jgi:hypothetical protein
MRNSPVSGNAFSIPGRKHPQCEIVKDGQPLNVLFDGELRQVLNG